MQEYLDTSRQIRPYSLVSKPGLGLAVLLDAPKVHSTAIRGKVEPLEPASASMWRSDCVRHSKECSVGVKHKQTKPKRVCTLPFDDHDKMQVPDPFTSEGRMGRWIHGRFWGAPIFSPEVPQNPCFEGFWSDLGQKSGVPQTQIQRPRIQRPILGPLIKSNS